MSWYKQPSDKPLFEDMLWNRPENKRLAGKLLVIGGNQYLFSAPGIAYDTALKSGVGVVKVLLPSILQKTLGSVLEDCEFAPTNKSGSFAKTALAEWLDWAHWADGVLLAGDMGRNSETSVVLEQFVRAYKGPLVITQDCLDQFSATPLLLFERPNTVIVASFGQLQKMWPKLRMEEGVIQQGLPLVRNLDLLCAVSTKYPASVMTKINEELVVANGGQVSTTVNIEKIWRVATAASASVRLIQSPQKPFEALTTSVYVEPAQE